jgi:hypothetical protein
VERILTAKYAKEAGGDFFDRIGSGLGMDWGRDGWELFTAKYW